MTPIYLDCAATCPVDPEVAEVVRRCMLEEYGNPSSRHHEFGRRAAAAVSRARASIARVADADSSGIVFTSGATEANNIAILGSAKEGLRTGRTHILSTQIEHPSVLGPVMRLKDMGFDVEFAPPDLDGRISAHWIREHLRADTHLVSVMHVNNETGAIQPIPEICDVLEGHPARLHVDCTQSFGRLPGAELPRIDFVSCSAHKLCGPKGIGALIRRRGTGLPLEPMSHGGGQEQALRPGTLPTPLIVGFACAAEQAARHRDERWSLANELRKALLNALKPIGAIANGHHEHTSPYILNVSLTGLDSEAFIIGTKDLVAVSNGSACSSSSVNPSHVLTAMGLSESRIASAVRFSWCHLTGHIDLNALVDRVGKLL